MSRRPRATSRTIPCTACTTWPAPYPARRRRSSVEATSCSPQPEDPPGEDLMRKDTDRRHQWRRPPLGDERCPDGGRHCTCAGTATPDLVDAEPATLTHPSGRRSVRLERIRRRLRI